MAHTDPDSADTSATAPVLGPGHTYATVTDKISALVLVRPYNWRWFLGMGIGLVLTMVLFVSITVLLLEGVGIWGIDVPVMWGFAIINFVWWIGIGHAGTLISAILLLLKQDWRTSINRFAEAMTLFAVACAGLFPLLHLGRPWLFYWLLPYPNTMGLWPQWRSPLVWDVFAVSTYATVSLLFWYVGLIPDMATLRDRAQNRWAQYHLWVSRDGLARFGAALAPLPDCVPAPGRPGDAAGCLGPHDRGPRFHGRDLARLAQHHLSPLLRRRRDFFGLCDGGHAGPAVAGCLRPARLHHASSPRQHGQGHARHWHDRFVRLPDGSLHGVVQSEPVRDLRPAQEPPIRPVRAHLLDDADLQRLHPAAPLESPCPGQRAAPAG